MSDQADSIVPATTPAPASTSPPPAFDDATDAVTILRLGTISGATLTPAQAQVVLKSLAGTAALAVHASKLEELVASYGEDMNAVSRSLGAAHEAISAMMIMPSTYDYDKAAKARADLSEQLKANGSITSILAAALKVAATFI